MCEPAPEHASAIAAQTLYAKLQKLSEDIQLQHSILTAQKETVLKSRQKVIYETQKTEVPAGDPTHVVHTHADTVLQHRAMIIKHYELIRQHKQMVKEQGLHVQNLTSALLNIQQETTVVDELMNTRMAESRTRTLGAAQPPTPSIPPPLLLIDNNHDYKTNKDKPTASQRTTKTRYTELPPINTSFHNNTYTTTTIARDTKKEEYSSDNDNTEQITTITLTTITSSTSTPSTTTSTTISSISTTTHTIPPADDDAPLPLSP